MRNTYLSSRATQQKKIESENISKIGPGITKRLLEKYKPKRSFQCTKDDRQEGSEESGLRL